MSTIINPAWKGKKEGDEVTYKGEIYTIGSDAYGSLNDAIADGQTSDLIILDKKLTSPVTVKSVKEYITGAATDIFASTLKETESADGKTTTEEIKFSAAAGGTASVKDSGSELKGFEKVTAESKTGDSFSFQGGKQDISSNVKEFNDSDKGIATVDMTASIASSATGELTVKGVAASPAGASIGAIKDIEGRTDDTISIIKDIYKESKGEDYEGQMAAAYAKVTLTAAAIDTDIYGGSYTTKATGKTSNNNDEKKTAEYSYSFVEKSGSGSATLKDSSVDGGIRGFKTVKITTASVAAPVSIGSVKAGDKTEDYSVKTAYTADASSTYDAISKETKNVSGSLTITGKDTKEVVVDDTIKRFSDVSLKFAKVQGGEIVSEVESEKATMNISVKNLKDSAALTASYSYEETETATGKLTVDSSVIGDSTDPTAKIMEGIQSVTIKNSEVNGVASAANKKLRYTKKETGTAVEGINEDASVYVSKFDVDYEDTTGDYDDFDDQLVDESAAKSLDFTLKKENSVGGTSFKMSGKVKAASDITVEGYKTVSLDNTDWTVANSLTATITNTLHKPAGYQTYDKSKKVAFVPESSYTYTSNTTVANKASGDATIKGHTRASVDGFASVKASGKIDDTMLTGVVGENTYNHKSSGTITIKAAKDAPQGSYSSNSTTSDKIASTLDASNLTISGGYGDLKTVKLQNVKTTAGVTFANSVDSDSKSSENITWNAEEISADEKVPTNFYEEKVTSWNVTSESKNSIVGSFTLKNTNAAATITDIGVDDFKSVDINLQQAAVTITSLGNFGDSSAKYSLKRTVSETKRSTELKDDNSTTAVGTLKLTGKNGTAFTTAGNIGYSSITLKDAVISGGAVANSYAFSNSFSVSESATLDSGTVDSVTLKVSRTGELKGNGSFSATINGSVPLTAFAGTLNGYNTISLKDKLSIGNVNNYKYVGYDAAKATLTTYVPWDGEYFDFYAAEKKPSEFRPADAKKLDGNVSGTYKMDKNGQIDANWIANYSTTAAGSFTQSSTVTGVTAGNITGYDKVSLNGVVTVGNISGTNSETSEVLVYKTSKDGDVVADSDVTVTTLSSANKAELKGKKFTGDLLVTPLEVKGIYGYKNVTLQDVTVKNAAADTFIEAVDYEIITTEDKVAEFKTIETNSTAIGTLSATDSTFDVSTGKNISVDGFQTVRLTNTAADAKVDFTGGSSSQITVISGIATAFEEQVAAGSFTATSNAESLADPELNTIQTVGNITGFQKVSLTDYNAGTVAVSFASDLAANKSTYVKVIPADDEKETPKIWQKAAATKNNSFTASADYYYDSATATIKQNLISVGDISGYGKVEATGLTSIGSIDNAFVTDSVAYLGRIYDAKHYGSWNATAKEAETQFTAISADASGSVKIKGAFAKDKAGVVIASEATNVTGNIAGYSTVSLEYVNLGDATSVKNLIYAGGKYAYSTKTNSDEDVIATSKDEAAGKLSISNAGFVGQAGSTIDVKGFKTVAIDLTGSNVKFAGIVGGTEEMQFTNGTWDYTKYSYSGDNKLTLATEEGLVAGDVSGFMEMTFTDTNLEATTGVIDGYQLDAKKKDGVWVGYQTARSTVTFVDTADTAENTIAGSINDAKSVVFKADADTDPTANDFVITADIISVTGEMTVEFDSQAKADLSKFVLGTDDVIDLSADSVVGLYDAATAAYAKLDDQAAVTTYFTGMAGATFAGSGIIAFSSASFDESTIEAAIKAANVNFADGSTITFSKV